eukprot:2575031-Rhodomonas_salina.1
MACESLEMLQAFKSEFLTSKQSTHARSFNCTELGTSPLSKHSSSEAGVRLSKINSPEVADQVLHRQYWGITGHLSFLVSMMRCNLAFAYAELSKFIQLPGPEHLKAAERMLQFLCGSYEDKLTYSYPGPTLRNKLLVWVDSDYASDPYTRKLVTGYMLSLNNAPVSWKAKRQDCVTLSSAEAEYVAASMAGQEVVYLRAILQGFGIEQTTSTEVWEDDAACIQIAKNPVNRKFTRHIDVRSYYVRDLVQDGVMTLVKCAGTHNVADALTKSLQGPAWSTHRPYLTCTRTEYKVFFPTLGITEPTAVAWAEA